MVLTIVVGLIGLGIMVFVHELGHFLAAKAVGVEVEVFSLGWGRRLVGFTRGGTTYQIALFPVGGFCRMKGEEAFREAIRDRLPEFPRVEGSFYTASPLKRILVAIGGPLANVLFAVSVLSVIWLAGFNVTSADNRIVLASDYGQPSNAPATVAGLKTGDRVVAIAGQPITNFQEITERVASSAERPLVFTVVRDEDRMGLTVTPALDRETGGGRIGVYAWTEPVVDTVKTPSAADLAGLRKGDRIVSVDGHPVRHLMDIVAALETDASEVVLVLEREGQEVTTELGLSRDAQGRVMLEVGFAQAVYRSPRLGVAGALREGASETWRTLVLTVTGLTTLFRGIDLQNAVAGPLRITYYVGTVAANGFAEGIGAGMVAFFRFLCLLSVVLFVMNLLPIPAFDGGQIVLFIVEAIRRKPTTPRLVQRTQLVGFAIMASLLVVFTVSDIAFFVGQ